MTRSYPPPEWRYRPEPPPSSCLWDVLVLVFMIAIIAGIMHLASGCVPLVARAATCAELAVEASPEHGACCVVGVTLTAASERIVDAMVDDYVRSDDDAEVDERWQAPLAAYETAAVAQNAWADALDAGQEYPVESVRGVYCTARAVLVDVVAMPDWPMGGCQ